MDDRGRLHKGELGARGRHVLHLGADARELKWRTEQRAKPELVVCDNGPEFTSKALDQ